MPYSVCALSKAKQKHISTSDMTPSAKIPAKRIFFDSFFQKKRSLDGNFHWLLVVDDDTDNVIFSFENKISSVSCDYSFY